MEKRKNNDHEKIRTELEKRFKDIDRKIEYGSHIGCKEGDGKHDVKKDGDEKTKKRKNNEVKLCKYTAYGCTIRDNEKKNDHLIEFSKHCKFNGASEDFIASEREKYLSLIITSETGELGKFIKHISR